MDWRMIPMIFRHELRRQWRPWWWIVVPICLTVSTVCAVVGYRDVLMHQGQPGGTLLQTLLLPAGTGWAPIGAWGYRDRNHKAIVKGLEGGKTAFGGKAFADKCSAFAGNNKALSDNVAEVEDVRKQVNFY